MGVIRKVREQRVPLIIPGAGASVESVDVNLDILYDDVVGVQATCTDPKAFQTSYFENFEIGNLKIFDKGHEAKMLSGGQGLNVALRYDQRVQETAKGHTVNMTYKDGSVAGTTYPYTVNVYFWLQNPDMTENPDSKADEKK